MAGSADIRERFAREAKAISSLNHANICTLYDIGHDDGRDYPGDGIPGRRRRWPNG